jgi:multidrug efflux pump subunit AcrA (membrane-fusion protein)
MAEEAGFQIPWRWAIGTAAVLAVVLAIMAFRGPAGLVVTTATAAKRDLVVPILSDGSLEPPPGGELRAPEAATVAAIPAREGDRVARGAPLVVLESPELTQAALAARSTAAQLSEERVRATGDLEQSRREAAHAKEVFEADARLVKESAIARATLEADELAYGRAVERLRAAQARFDSLVATSSGESRLELARASARELDRRVAALTVRAPADGIVYGLPRKAGETVRAGELVAAVADPEHLRVRARVDQPDLPRIAVGQRLIVTFDGLPDRRWEGKVTAVSPGVRESGGREVGEVLGEIADTTRSLPPNASVNVQIVTAEKRGVLAIPRAALFRDGDRRYVYRLEEGRARRHDVSVGLVGLNDIEVTGGLKENDAVILPGTVPLSDDLRVKIARPGSSASQTK